MTDNNALLEQVKAAILAKIAAMGPCNSDEMRQEVLTQVPAVNSDNMHTLVYQARKQLIEEELIEEDEAIVYDLSDSYYSSEHNPNNYQEYKEPVEDLYRECG